MSSSASAARSNTQPFSYEEASSHSGGETRRSAAEEIAAREAAARSMGRAEAEASSRSLMEQQAVQVKAAIADALEQFEKQRQVYYEKIEREVVELALAIAHKILHRESQVDPLMLAGIVKVTLEKLNAGTEVRVRVHPNAGSEWRHYFSCHMQSRVAPEVVDDPSLPLERCVLETSLGQTELGVEPQLKEIERGLLDLLAKRPTEKA
jgi:flagellar assembly protein FliH